MRSIEKLSQRVRALEQNQEPMDIKLYWSEDEIPQEIRDSVIRLKWPEEL